MIKHRLASGADVRQEIERVAEAEFETALENDVTSSLVVHYAKARRGGLGKCMVSCISTRLKHAIYT